MTDPTEGGTAWLTTERGTSRVLVLSAASLRALRRPTPTTLARLAERQGAPITRIAVDTEENTTWQTTTDQTTSQPTLL